MAKILKEIGFNDALPRVFSTWASWGESPPTTPLIWKNSVDLHPQQIFIPSPPL